MPTSPTGRHVASTRDGGAEVSSQGPKRMRGACDLCHQSKIRCSGAPRCEQCISLGIQCHFSPARVGRPKGARNKSTWDKIRRHEAQARADNDEASDATSGSMHNTAAWPDEPSRNTTAAAPQVMGSMYDQGFSLQSYAQNGISPFDSGASSQSNLAPSSVSGTNAGEDDLGLNDPLDAGFMSPEDMPFPPLQGGSVHQHMRHASGQHSPQRDGNAWHRPTSSRMHGSVMGNEDVDHFAGWMSAPVQYPSHQSTTFDRIQSASPSGACGCLSSTFDVMMGIKKSLVTRDDGVKPVDMLLLSANQVLETSNRSLDCSDCSENQDGELLLLITINIRRIIKAFSEVVQAGNRIVPDHPYLDQVRRSSIASVSCSSTSGSTEVSGDCDNTSGLPRIGRFHITGADGDLLINIVLAKVLARFKTLIRRLKARSRALSEGATSQHPYFANPSPFTNSMAWNKTASRAGKRHENVITAEAAEHQMECFDVDHLRNSLRSIESRIDALMYHLRLVSDLE